MNARLFLGSRVIIPLTKGTPRARHLVTHGFNNNEDLVRGISVLVLLLPQ